MTPAFFAGRIKGGLGICSNYHQITAISSSLVFQLHCRQTTRKFYMKVLRRSTKIKMVKLLPQKIVCPPPNIWNFRIFVFFCFPQLKPLVSQKFPSKASLRVQRLPSEGEFKWDLQFCNPHSGQAARAFLCGWWPHCFPLQQSQWELLTVSCCFSAGASFWGSLGSMCRKEVDETFYPPSADFSISDKSMQPGILSIAYSQG